MILVANNKAPEVLQPSKQTFDLPTTFVASQYSAILAGRFAAVASMRGNHLQAPFGLQSLVQPIRVIGLVTDQTLGQFFQETGVQGSIDQGHFVRTSPGGINGDRKTFSVRKAHNFGTFTAFGLAHTKAPFFAGLKVPSINPSLRSMPPRWQRSSAKAERIFSNIPERVHCWKRRWQVWYGGYRLGRSAHGAPVRSTQRMASSTSRGLRGGRPGFPGPALGLGMKSTIRCHCSFVSSMPYLSGISKLILWGF